MSLNIIQTLVARENTQKMLMFTYDIPIVLECDWDIGGKGVSLSVGVKAKKKGKKETSVVTYDILLWSG